MGGRHKNFSLYMGTAPRPSLRSSISPDRSKAVAGGIVPSPDWGKVGGKGLRRLRPASGMSHAVFEPESGSDRFVRG